MKRTILLSLWLLLLTLPAMAQNTQKLASVKKIYLGELGKDEMSDLIREKIRIRLMKSDRFSVVETPESADAILIGATGVSSKHVSTISTNPVTGQVSGSGGTVYEGNAVVRLVDAQTKETIWIYEYKRGFFRPRSASGDIAGKIIDHLTKDAKKLNEKPQEPNAKNP